MDEVTLDETQLPGWWKVAGEISDCVVRTDGVRVRLEAYGAGFGQPAGVLCRIEKLTDEVRGGLGLDPGASALEVRGEGLLEGVARVDRASPPMSPRPPPLRPLPLGFHFVVDAEGRLLLEGDRTAGLFWINSLFRDFQK